MGILKECLYALYYQKFEIFFTNKNFIIIIYLLVFCVLFLENGVIFASFLPGDSLLVFCGILVGKGLLSFPITLGVLIIAAGLGSWMSYLQGKWLDSSKLVIRQLIDLPDRYCNYAFRIFHTYGLLALFFGRFIVFVRTLLPIIAGLSGISSVCFHFLNWVSAFIWILTLVFSGFMLGKTEIIQEGEHKLILSLFMLLCIVFFLIGLVRYVQRKK